jgi:hypothetical protein
MFHLLPPEAWKGEAFAADLYDGGRARLPSPRPQRGVVMATFLGLLPLVLAMTGTALATWGGGA